MLKKTGMDQWNPRLQMSTAADTDLKARENKEFEFIYKMQLDKAMKIKREYAINLLNAYAEICKRSNKSLKA